MPSFDSTIGLARIQKLHFTNHTLLTPAMLMLHKTNDLKFWNNILNHIPPTEGIMLNLVECIRSSKFHYMQKKGIHTALNFNGTFFLDSGGYLVRNEDNLVQQWNPSKIDQLHSIMGDLRPDLITTFDYPLSKDICWEDTKKITFSILAALHANNTPDRSIKQLASVHGRDSLEISNIIKFLEKNASFDGYALGSLVPQRQNLERIVKLVIAARMAIPSQKYLHVYGLGGVPMLHLLFYCGADTVDSSTAVLSGGIRDYLVPNRGYIDFQEIRKLRQLPCYCRICKAMNPNMLDERDALAIHNYLATLQEVLRARMEIERKTYESYLCQRFASNSEFAKAFEIAKHLLHNRWAAST